MRRLRILIADDHDVVRLGLRNLLDQQEGWEVVGEATNGRDAVALAEELRPDVVVLDVTMPRLNGLEAARLIRRALPGTEILVLTMHGGDDMVRRVLDAGARGLLLKSDALKDVVDAVATLGEHKPYVTPAASATVHEGFLETGDRPERGKLPHETLTAREREVLQLIAEGKSTKAVAKELRIAPKTAETHRTNLMRKLQVHSVGELVRYAIRNRIVEA